MVMIIMVGEHRRHVVLIVTVIQHKFVVQATRIPFIRPIVRVTLNIKLLLNHGHTFLVSPVHVHSIRDSPVLRFYKNISFEKVSVPCSPNPCQNGGSCSSPNYPHYTCSCVNSYTGTNCEIGNFVKFAFICL